jgi:hypothetical protein
MDFVTTAPAPAFAKFSKLLAVMPKIPAADMTGLRSFKFAISVVKVGIFSAFV